ncbi:MAG: PEP-CTERM sorting domain-containing protein [Pirellulaceae bacterium]
MNLPQFLLGLVFCTLGIQCATADLVETFSGTGPYSTTNTGLSGFENPGWAQLGNAGAFSTNSSGDQVFAINTPPQTGEDGFRRNVGTTAFSSVLEVVNLDFDSGGSSYGAGVGLFASENVNGTGVYGSAGIGIYELNGEYSAKMGYAIGNDFYFPFQQNLGTSVPRIELFLDYAPDSINGGGIFSTYYELNHSGNRIHLGTIDGTMYTNSAEANREFFMNSYGAQGGYSEFNRFEITAVPEPPTLMGVALGCLAAVLVRRKAKR